VNHPTLNALAAEKTMQATLAALSLPIRGSYGSKEVCSILGVSSQTIFRLSRKYAVDATGKLITPNCLKCFILGNNRRVAYLEILDFIRRNNAAQREAMQEPQNKAVGSNYSTFNAIQAEKTVKAALAVLSIPVRGSYHKSEVCSVFGITEQSFWRLLRKYAVDAAGNMVRPDCLKTFLQGNNRRVTYAEIVDFIRRNDEHLRNTIQGERTK